jgi:hypothetical protein
MGSEGAGGALARRERRRPQPGVQVLPGLVVAAAVVAFAVGAFTLGGLAGDGSGHAGHAPAGAGAADHSGHAGGAPATAELNGLALQVEVGDWVNLDMLGGPTPANAGPFKMPMTGVGNMPSAGSDRFHVEVLIANQGDASQAVTREEFRLSTPDGKLWSPNQDDTSDQDPGRKSGPGIAQLLAPGQMTDLDLFFDVPEKSGEPVLLWSRAGELQRVPLKAGVAPQHQH